MATRSSSPGRSASARSVRPRAAKGDRSQAASDAAAAGEGGVVFEDVAVRAKRLGVTPERVLREYAAIAFADWRKIVEWKDDGLHVKQHLSKNNARPIAEMSAVAAGKGTVRVKLYDKKAALDAIARHLGMFTPSEHRQDDEDWEAAAENAREELARRLARLTAKDEEA